jgi:sigma-B regulation protein RsbU (phosphoserine phosphatase)
MRLRALLLAAMVMLVTALLGMTVGAVKLVLGRMVERGIADDLRRGQRAFEELQRFRGQIQRSEARVVAEEPRLKAVVATEEVNHETVLGVISELRGALQSDLLLLADAEGRLIADATRPDAQGHSLSDRTAVSTCLADGAGGELWYERDHAYQVHARRLAFGATPVGVLVVGYAIDDRLTEILHRQIGTAAVITLDGRPLAVSGVTRRPALGRDIATSLAALGEPVRVQVEGVHHVATTVAFPEPASGRAAAGPPRLRVTLLRSLDEALAPSRRLLLVIYGIAASALMMALGLAFLLARRLSRPIDELVGFTGRIARGEQEPLAFAGGPVEVRTLTEAMNRMVREIEESRQKVAIKERLEKELEIAATLQTSILPHQPETTTLEVAARMVPATEVGGDYYDVIGDPNGAWVAIGDVSGHGLPAGVVMLMIQSVMAALTRQPEARSPRLLVSLLNRVLHDNLRKRMNRDEFATFTLLRLEADGRVTHAGAHEEIVIWRRATGRCERLPTPGTWLGAKRDISRVTVDSTFALDEGDLLVLYTDGITEAMDAQGQQFGLDRLCQAVEAAAGRTPEEVRDQVLAAAMTFAASQADDMTLVVLRRR